MPLQPIGVPVSELAVVVAEDWIEEGDHLIQEIAPVLRWRRQVTHAGDHRHVGLLAVWYVRQRLAHRDDRLPAMVGHRLHMLAEFGSVESMCSAGDPEICEVAVTGVGLAPLHRRDDLLREVSASGYACSLTAG